MKRTHGHLLAIAAASLLVCGCSLLGQLRRGGNEKQEIQDETAQESPSQVVNEDGEGLADAAPMPETVVDLHTPKREFRGAWIHIVGNQKMKTMTTEQIQKWFTGTLDTLRMAGCNAVVFQVRPQADAFFPSDLEPWTRFLTGTQGQAPKPYWDPLQFMIDECHARGMELHAWLNPYRVTSNDREELCKKHMYWKNKGIFRKYGKQLYFDPGEPESRRHTVKVIADIVRRYDVDAIHFDDYFYPYPIDGQDFPDEKTFAKYGKVDGFTPDRKNDWRRHNTEILMKEINDTIKSIKPWVRFGISPFGIHRNLKDTPDGSGSATNGLSNYEQLYADVPLWAEKGYIDYIAPQIYWKIGHPRADYDVLINWWHDSHFKGHLYIGQNISTFNEPDLQDSTTTQMKRKMELVRTLPDVHGNIWWPGWSIPRNECAILDSLSGTYQRVHALIPEYSWIDDKAPEAVTSVTAAGGVLTWCTEATDDIFQQPHFYIVYRYARGERADLKDPAHIIAITRSCYFRPDDGDMHEGDRYIVTVVDRCWNESPASAEASF